MYLVLVFAFTISAPCRSQWPRGLRRGSTAARLLGLWVRIPPGHGCLSLVSVVCCQVEVSTTGWSLVQRSPTECGVSKKCAIVKPRKLRRPWPPRDCLAIGKKKIPAPWHKFNEWGRLQMRFECLSILTT
jgi:hypothetical protein